MKTRNTAPHNLRATAQSFASIAIALLPLVAGCASNLNSESPAELGFPVAQEVSPGPGECAGQCSQALKAGEPQHARQYDQGIEMLAGQETAVSPEAETVERKAFEQEVPGATVKLKFAPVPAGACKDAEGKDHTVGEFWMTTTEIPWEIYDVLVHRLDLSSDESGAHAETRPSKPYINMDRGFGHNGYPALSMSYKGAEAFCVWLSKETGKTYRLPTQWEWEHACRAGRQTPLDAAALEEIAWVRANSDFKTHPVGKKAANAFGLYDMLGNASEWVSAGEGKALVCGGCYRDRHAKIGASLRLQPRPDWNASDPQIPKSVWWLADGGFVGFRVVHVPK